MSIFDIFLDIVTRTAAEKAINNLLESIFIGKCQVSGCGDKANYETKCCEKGICDFHIESNIKKKKGKFVCPICGHKTCF